MDYTQDPLPFDEIHSPSAFECTHLLSVCLLHAENITDYSAARYIGDLSSTACFNAWRFTTCMHCLKCCKKFGMLIQNVHSDTYSRHVLG